jgi:hypothetical protein
MCVSALGGRQYFVSVTLIAVQHVCISLVANDVNIVMYFFALGVFSLVKCLFMSFA